MAGPEITSSLKVIGTRPMQPGERAYVVRCWAEGFKESSRMRRKVWRDYKALDVPVLDSALSRPDTNVIVATNAGHTIGFIVFARWPSIDTVHWLYVMLRHRSPEHLVRDRLLQAAELKPRIAYTHEAPVSRRWDQRQDERIAAELRERGHVVSYLPYAEWSR